MTRYLRPLSICAISCACIAGNAQTLTDLTSNIGATLTTNADSITTNEDLVLRGGGGGGVPVKDYFRGNNDNPDGTTIVIGTGSGATTTINGNTSVGNELSVGGASSMNGIDNNGQRITNIAPGVAATDAASYGQLEAVVGAQTTINNNQTAINNAQAATNQALQNQTTANRRVSSTGIAIVAAAAALPALEAGKQFGIGVGVGTYDGRSAISVGMAARLSQQLQIKLHAGTGNSGKVAVGAGGMWSW